MRTTYSVTISVTIIITIYNIIKAGKSLSITSKWIQRMLIGATIIEIANLAISFHYSFISKSTFFAYSVYFATMDWVVFFLFCFVVYFTEQVNNVSRIKLWVMFSIMVVDSLSLLLNNFSEHAFSYYVSKFTDGYEYLFIIPYWPFQLHLVIDYIMLLFIFARLIRKMITSVSYYKTPYAVQFFTILSIVVINGLYLLWDYPLDWSIIMYSVAGILINFFSEVYIPKSLMNKSLRSTTDDLGEGLILFDINDKCVYTNRSAEKMFNITADALTIDATPVSEWTKGFSARDIRPFEETYSLDNGRGGTIQYKLRLKHITDAKGQYLGCYFVTEDITKEYKYTLALEQTTREAEKAREDASKASMAKGAFLANMSHEIRTPINAILGMNEMILREDASQEIKEYARNIQSAGDALLSIINDILDFSKIESGKMELQPVVYEPFRLIKNCEMMIQPRINSKNLSLVVKCDENCPKALRGDEIRIRQIVTNLLTNAAKYTEEGTVTIDLQWEPLNEAKGSLIISVIDTGIGISEENQKKLFTAFQRVDEERNRNIEGTGLGLSITNQLISLMKGNITVTSNLGSGSTFIATIPQTIIDNNPSGSYTVSKSEHKATYHELFTAPDAKILAVDDYKMNLTVLKGLLKKTQIQLSFAQSGQEAVEKASAEHFDLILMDHMMPGMDGVEALKILKGMDTPNNNTPFIMLTANAISGAEDDYLKAGFEAYLTKPIDSKQLEEALLRYLPDELIVK